MLINCSIIWIQVSKVFNDIIFLLVEVLEEVSTIITLEFGLFSFELQRCFYVLTCLLLAVICPFFTFHLIFLINRLLDLQVILSGF